MPTGYTYSSYVTELATLAVVAADDPNFVQNLPSAIDYAELRICQDLDLLYTVTAATGFALTANKQALVIDSDPKSPAFVTIQDINVITPAGTSDPTYGTRNPCLPVSKEYLYTVWPSSGSAGVPNKFAMLNQSTVLFGPWPDQAYSLELVGTVRPAPLSASNPTTFISQNLPSLFMMASMIYIGMYQRNFGRVSDDPQMAVTYESQYQALKATALNEEWRKKFESTGWTSMSPAPSATPQRN